ncbi:glucokinase [Ascosphaera atra]|nr:glucokinase [Ascosphaera atra]
MTTPAVVEEAVRLAKQFMYPKEEIRRGVEEFLDEMAEGNSREGATMSQIPSYITAVPNGDETGLYLAVDLGGTNFRVCSVYLLGDGKYTMRQSKAKVPHELMEAEDYKDLFNFMAEHIENFIREHLAEHWSSHLEKKRVNKQQYVDEELFDMGFTFSFPVAQHAINKGRLIRWSKGFTVKSAIGKDVCEMLQEALDARHLPVRVVALVNDTVGTLMARAYTSGPDKKTLLGAIFGTGTNGAYVEKMSKIPKLKDAKALNHNGHMLINCEWGSFDNPLKVLPNTKWDIALNAESVNPTFHKFEKHVSGMYLGELLRRVMLEMSQSEKDPLFGQATIPKDSVLYQYCAIDTSFLSIVVADDSRDLNIVANHLKTTLGIDKVTSEDCQAVQILAHAIGLRSARLAAVAISSVVIWSGRLEEDGAVDVGVDGSLVEFYPYYQRMIRETMHEIPQIGEDGEKRITIGIAKDGSGVGAALGALVATKMFEGKA